MKKRIMPAILIGAAHIGLILSVFLIAYNLFKKSQYKLIQDRIVEKCNDYTEIIIDMSDFTDFEWEQCIVYSAGTQTMDIQEVFHVNYNRVLDLSSGIIFVNNKEVVYEEEFKDIEYAFTNKTPEFLIYPFGENDSSQIKYAGFEKKEAKFICIKEYYNYKGLFGDKGYYYYRLYPIK